MITRLTEHLTGLQAFQSSCHKTDSQLITQAHLGAWLQVHGVMSCVFYFRISWSRRSDLLQRGYQQQDVLVQEGLQKDGLHPNQPSNRKGRPVITGEAVIIVLPSYIIVFMLHDGSFEGNFLCHLRFVRQCANA